jgi:hypothetical protein
MERKIMKAREIIQAMGGRNRVMMLTDLQPPP